VLLAIGSTVPRNLAIPGREGKNILYAMQALSANTKSLLDSNLEDKQYVEMTGKRVVVIGGGELRGKALLRVVFEVTDYWEHSQVTQV
jgi:glutamate synthase (NADPH/NADH) small chain